MQCYYNDFKYFSRKTKKETQMKFHKVMAGYHYVVKFWKLGSLPKDFNMIHASEMEFLRLRMQTMNEIRNDFTRQESDISSLNYTNSEYRNNWLYHVERIREDKLPKRSFDVQTNREDTSYKTAKGWLEFTDLISWYILSERE